MIVQAKDLSPEQKAAVESLLGRSVSDRETVTVQAFEEPALSAERRQEIVESLQRYFAEVDAKRRPVSSQEEDEIFEEAMRSSRPNFRSCP